LEYCFFVLGVTHIPGLMWLDGLVGYYFVYDMHRLETGLANGMGVQGSKLLLMLRSRLNMGQTLLEVYHLTNQGSIWGYQSILP